jgi:biopolymer transport protein ExbB
MALAAASLFGVLWLSVSLAQVGESDAPAATARSPAAAETGDVPEGAQPRSAGVSADQGISWKDVLDYPECRWLMYVLGALSFLTVAFVIYFFIVLRASQTAPRPLRRELQDKIRGGSIDEARKSCEYRKCPLSAVVLSALDYFQESPDADPVLLREVMQGEGGRQAEAIQGQTQYLHDIAVISPMIGLLGTVFGMLRAFSSVALHIAQAKPVALAGGVSQALITTAFGLIVGIPAMMFYAYFRRRASKLVSLLEAASADVLTSLLSRRQQSERVL